MLNQSTLIT